MTVTHVKMEVHVCHLFKNLFACAILVSVELFAQNVSYLYDDITHSSCEWDNNDASVILLLVVLIIKHFKVC